MKNFGYLLLIIGGMGTLSTQAEEPKAVFSEVFVSGQGGYHTYRIPALLVTPKGTVLAFCEGRKTGRGDHGDLDMVLRRSTDGGKTWLPLQLIYEEGGDKKITIGNPCPVVDRSNNRIWLPFTRDNDDVFITYSDDEGASWKAPTKITDQVKLKDWTWYATGPGVGIQMQHGKLAGRLVIPCDHRATVDGVKGMTRSHAFYSDDHGKTWQLGEAVGPFTNECQVVELSDGRLQINMRNYMGRDGMQADKDKQRAIAHSSDGGQTWSALAYDAALIEPVCQASLITYPSTQDQPDWLLFSNPASATTRHRLTIRLSRDGGQTWPTSRLLFEGNSAYSCLAVLPDRTVGCLLEGGTGNAYEKILFAQFPIQWLTDQP